jgi:hypothetical protein
VATSGSASSLGASFLSAGKAGIVAAMTALFVRGIGDIADLFQGDLSTSRTITTSIGFAILGPLGAALGNLLGGLFEAKPNLNVGVGTGRTEAEIRARSLEGGAEFVERSVFGFLGALGGQTGGDVKGGAVQDLLRSVAAIDLSIAQTLTRAERLQVLEAGLPDVGFSNPSKGIEKITRQRIEDVLGILGIPEAGIRGLGLGADVSAEEQIQRATGLLEERRAIQAFLDDANGVVVVGKQASEALDGLADALDAIRLRGPQVGIVIEDFAALEAKAQARLRTGFVEGLSDQILALTNPLELAMQQQIDRETELLASAERFGAGRLEAERLFQLERQEIERRNPDPLREALDQIRVTPSGQAPTTALLAAQTRFDELEAEVRAGGSIGARQDLAAAAQTLLGLGEQFLGGPRLGSLRDEIVDVFAELALPLSGQAADTGAQLADLNRLTDQGNQENAQLLLRVIDRLASIENENRLLRESYERLENRA